MQKLLSVLLTVSVVVFIMGLGFESRASDIARWSELQQFEQKFKAIPKSEKIRQGELIDQVASFILKLVPNQKQKLDGAQVRDLVHIVRVIGEADLGNVIWERNLILLQNNAKAIRAEVKKLPPKEAEVLDEVIEVVLSGSITSDPAQPDAIPSKKPAPAIKRN